MERLGGIDFDEALFNRAIAQVRAAGVEPDPSDPATLAAIARLREECRRAKEALSSDTDTAVAIFLPGLQTEMRLTRAEFEDMIRPRIRETIEALARSVRSAGLEMSEVDRILLVGGSSRIPLVAEMVREATGRPVAVDAHPKHTMALGAAYVAEQARTAAEAMAGPSEAGAMGTATAATSAATVAASAAAEAVPTPPPSESPTEVVTVPAVALPAAPAVAAAADDRGAPPPPPVEPSAAGGGGGRRPAMPIVAAVGALALVAALAVGASALLSNTPGASPTAPASLAVASPSPSVAPSLTPVPTPAPTPSPTPTPVPTPTPTPAGRQARITGITIQGGAYAVEFQVFGFQPDVRARHVHFFWDTVPPTQAGVPANSRNWILYDTPSPFTGYKVAAKPAAARQMCILVANQDHSVNQDTGNCMDLPS
jgi:hypothetical protein